MPSKSRAQQRLMQAAEHGATFAMARKLRQTMTHQQLHDFAVGSERGKPQHVAKPPHPKFQARSQAVKKAHAHLSATSPAFNRAHPHDRARMVQQHIGPDAQAFLRRRKSVKL